MVCNGVVHMAAASITETDGRKQLVHFSKPLLKVVPELVYRLGQPRPKNLGDLHGVLRIVKDSAPVEKLRNLQASRYPQLKWDETNEDVAEELLYQRSEEHTSELQSLMRISYAVFCLKKKKK